MNRTRQKPVFHLMKKMLGGIALTVLALAGTGIAQIVDTTWKKNIIIDSAGLKLTHYPCGFDKISRTHTGDYLVSGYGAYSDPISNSTVYFVAVGLCDTNFIVKWYRELGIPDWIYDVTEGNDSTFLVVGKGDTMAMVSFHLSSSGVILSTNRIPIESNTTFDPKSNPRIYGVFPLRQGGYIACGGAESYPLVSIWAFVKMNASGALIWKKYYSLGIGAAPRHITEAQNGKLLFVGNMAGVDPFMRYGLLNSSGDSIFTCSPNPTNYGWLETSYEIAPNKFLIIGKWSRGSDVWMAIIDSTGLITKQRFLGAADGNTYNPYGYPRTFAIYPADNNCYIIQTSYSIAKIDTSLKLLWTSRMVGLATCMDKNRNLLLLCNKNIVFGTALHYPPFFTSSSVSLNKNIDACSLYRDTIIASDSFPNDILIYRLLSPHPIWASIDSSRGIVSGTPGLSDTGVYSIGVTVADRLKQMDTLYYSVTVGVNYRKMVEKFPLSDTVSLKRGDITVFSITQGHLCLDTFQVVWFLDSRVVSKSGSYRLTIDSVLDGRNHQIRACLVSGTDTILTYGWYVETGILAAKKKTEIFSAGIRICLITGTMSPMIIDFPSITSSSQDINFTLYNLSGRKIGAFQPQLSGNIAIIAFAPLKRGLYICELAVNGKKSIQRILLTK